MREPIKLFRYKQPLLEDGVKNEIWLPKISRKRFIGVAMYYGMSHRDAVEMADCANKMGVPYRDAVICLRRAVLKAAPKKMHAEAAPSTNI